MSHQPSIVCFGEILWDVLPDRTLPGGAPMNVAYHLNKLGVDTHLISRIGNDEQGKKLLTLFDSWSLSTQYVQVDNKHKTSEVHAVEGENHEMKYEILFPVAWDFIQYDNCFQSLLKETDALVFGSLVTRNTVSQLTLQSLLEIARYKVFDINLRAPHYSSVTIKDLLKKTNLLKLNENELTEVAEWYSTTVKTPQDSIKLLQEDFGIKEIIITNGSKGSTYVSPGGVLSQKAYPVKVADTIGSGDSFLAGFLAKKFQGEPAEVALSTAAALASFVTSHHGACPDYSIADLEHFRMSHEMS
jgi:fructokinase